MELTKIVVTKADKNHTHEFPDFSKFLSKDDFLEHLKTAINRIE